MKGKDKMLAAMTSGLESDFPVVIPYLGLYLRDNWDEITDQPWWIGYSPNLSARLKVDEDLQKKLDLDWVQCGIVAPRKKRESYTVETRGDRVFLVDTLSGEKTELHRTPVGGTHIAMDKEPLIKSMEDVDKYVNVLDEETIIQTGRLDYQKVVGKKFGSEKFICGEFSSPFCDIYLKNYFGFKELMLNLFKKPRLIEYLLEKITERSIEELRAYANVGVDGVWVQEAFSSANEISLSHYKRFILPYNKQLFSEMKRLGLKSIYYPCGDMRDRLELVIESGPDCIALEESKKNFEIDISWVNKAVAGRACIFGNLDAIGVLQDGTSTELRKEIMRQINVGHKYGKFVMSLGSPVTPQTPISRVIEYVNITRQESKSSNASD